MSSPVLYCVSDNACLEDVVVEFVLERRVPFKSWRVTIPPPLEDLTSVIGKRVYRNSSRDLIVNKIRD